MSRHHLQRAVVGEDAVQTWCGRTVGTAAITSVLAADGCCLRCWRAAPRHSTVRPPRTVQLVDTRRDGHRHLDAEGARGLPRTSLVSAVWSQGSPEDFSLLPQRDMTARWRAVRWHLARLLRAYRNGVPGSQRPAFVELWNFGVIVYSRRES